LNEVDFGAFPVTDWIAVSRDAEADAASRIREERDWTASETETEEADGLSEVDEGVGVGVLNDMASAFCYCYCDDRVHGLREPGRRTARQARNEERSRQGAMRRSLRSRGEGDDALRQTVLVTVTVTATSATEDTPMKSQ
jgi:hypothetical protein